jgi:hypothetical protein
MSRLLSERVLTGKRRAHRGPEPLPLVARLARHLEPAPGGCLRFVGARCRGHGVLWVPGRGRIYVSRLTWALQNGNRLPAHRLRAACGVRDCVAHLVPVRRTPRRSCEK